MALNQNMAPEMAGAEQGMPGGMPGMPSSEAGMPGGMPSAQGEMATPEQKQELLDMLDQIEAKYRDLNAQKFAGDNQSDSVRKEMLVSVFKAMQDAGIDVSNVQSVRQFLDEMEQSNPDLYRLFVDAFNALIGGEAPGAIETGEVTPGAGIAPEPASPEVGMAPSGMSPSSPALSGMVPPEQSAPSGGGPGFQNKWRNLAR
jgi:hypothetical protein